MKLSWTVYLLDSSRSDLKMVKSSLCICFISSLSICISERWVWIIWVISFNLCKIMSMLVPEDAPARTGEAGSGLMGQQVGSVLTPRQALLLLLGDSFSSLIRRPASCYWTKKFHYLQWRKCHHRQMFNYENWRSVPSNLGIFWYPHFSLFWNFSCV